MNSGIRSYGMRHLLCKPKTDFQKCQEVLRSKNRRLNFPRKLTDSIIEQEK